MLNRMSALELLIKGVLAGLMISAPVGPVNVLVVQRTIAKGCRAGLVAGLGAGFADTMYGAIAGFSITFVIRFLILEQFWIRLGGGCLLILIGIWYYRREPQGLRKQKNDNTVVGFVRFSRDAPAKSDPSALPSFCFFNPCGCLR